MLILATILLAMISILFMVQAAMKKDAQYLVIGFLGLFAFGHYVVPVIFRPLSHLRFVTDDEIIVVVFMVGVFLGALWLGFHKSVHLTNAPIALARKTSPLDTLLFRRPVFSFFVFTVIYSLYIVNSVQTTYQAGSVENYISQLSRLSAILASFGDLALAGMAIILAYMAKKRKRLTFVLLLSIYLASLIFLLGTAQRSTLISPIVSLAVAFSLFGKAKAVKFTVVGVIILLIVASPVLVLMRGTAGLSSMEALSALNNGESAQLVFLISILDRADGLLNMISLKDHIDVNGFANFQYFYSIVSAYVPGFLYAGKPTAMSITGGIDGHLSVIAWTLTKGSNVLGSLTVFGPITAYHEGGWLWLVVNGVMTGVGYNFIYRSLCGRSLWLKIIYVVIFPTLCVNNVPPSVFQLITSFSSIVYITIFLGLLSSMLRPHLRSAFQANQQQ